MAARINFDSSGNPVTPTILLGKRSGQIIGQIQAESIHLSDQMNGASELSLATHKRYNGAENVMWGEIIDFRLVYIPEYDMWYEIYSQISEDDDTSMSVIGKELGYVELSQVNLYDIEFNTPDAIDREYKLGKDYVPKVLYDPTNRDASMLDLMLDKVPHYSIKHVDSTIAKLQRSFTFDGTSIYDAFNQIAEEIGCLFIIKTGRTEEHDITREIYVYDLQATCNTCGYRGDFHDVCPECDSTDITEGYGEDTTIYVSADELGDDISFDTDEGSVKNCFKLEGGDDLMTATITNCNPNGTDYLWYLPEYSRKDMSEELQSALSQYDTDYKFYRDSYKVPLDANLVARYNVLAQKYIDTGWAKIWDGTKWVERLETIDIPVVGYSKLMQAYYDVIDFDLFLRHEMMPNVQSDDTDAQTEATKLSAGLSSISVAVENLSSLSVTTADSAVLAMAKAIVNSRYQTKIVSSSLSGYTWSGIFSIINYSDDTDSYTMSSPVSTTINGDMETFCKQRIEKTMAKMPADNLDIVALFHKDINSFKTELHKYALVSLETFNSAAQSALEILVEQGISERMTWNAQIYDGLYAPYLAYKAAIENEMTVRQNELWLITGRYENDETETGLITPGMKTNIVENRDSIQEALNFYGYIGEELLPEFLSFRREDKYSNSNYTSDGLTNSELFTRAQEFMKMARNDIYKSAELQHTISASLKDLLVIDRFKPLREYFCVGNWLRIRVDDNLYKLRLIRYELDYNDLSKISVDFSDVLKTQDGMADMQAVIKQAQSMASSYSSTQYQATKGEKSKATLDGWSLNGLDVTNQRIVAGATNQTQSWDEHGMLFRKYEDTLDDYNDEQLKILNSSLVFTDNNWISAKTAVGKFYYYDPADGNRLKTAYGINGEVIVGQLILGEQLGLYNSDQTLKFDRNGLLIQSATNHSNYFKVDPNSTDGYLLRAETSGSGYLRLTPIGNLTLSGAISNSNLTIGADGSINSNNQKFYVGSDGSLKATSADISGKITASSGSFTGSIYASSGTIGGWNIDSGSLYSGSTYLYSNGRIIGATIESSKLSTTPNGYGVMIDGNSINFISGKIYYGSIYYDGHADLRVQNTYRADGYNHNLILSGAYNSHGVYIGSATADNRVATMSDVQSSGGDGITDLRAVDKEAPSNKIVSWISATRDEDDGVITFNYHDSGSDIRLKNINSELKDFTKVYEQLKVYQFTYRSELKHYDSGVHYGVVAQDFKSLCEKHNININNDSIIFSEEPIDENNETMFIKDKVYRFRYEELHALHIQYNQYLNNRISKLEQENIRLQGEISIIKQKLEVLSNGND